MNYIIVKMLLSPLLTNFDIPISPGEVNTILLLSSTTKFSEQASSKRACAGLTVTIFYYMGFINSIKNAPTDVTKDGIN